MKKSVDIYAVLVRLAGATIAASAKDSAENTAFLGDFITKRMRKISLAVVTAAFYIGAILFFADDNIEAGLMGTVAGTLVLAALLANIRKQRG